MSQRKFSKNISNVSSVKTNNQLTPKVRKSSKSPISHSKCAHQTAGKQTVSYGQLQIVLENIQTIKQKASKQIKQLNQENCSLRQEISQMETSIDSLTSQLKAEREGLGTVEQKLRKRIEILEEDIEKRQQKIEERDRTIERLNSKVGQLQSNLKKEKEVSVESSKQLEEFKKKWNWAFTALAGDDSRAEEIVWKIKHSSCNLWEIFQKISSLQSILDLKTQKLESMTSELSQCKEEYRQTTGMLDKALTELNSANQKIKAGEVQIKEHYHKSLQFQEMKMSLDEIVHSLRRDKAGLHETIQFLQQKVKLLSQELVRKELVVAEKDKTIEYDNLVNEICDQTQDYSKVLQRLQYLERFRKEYYFNIQKIQYLCKLLDN